MDNSYQIDLVEILKIIFKRFRLLLLIMAIFILIPILYFNFIKESTYKTTFIITSYFFRNGTIQSNVILECIDQFNLLFNYQNKFYAMDVINKKSLNSLKDIEAAIDEKSSILISLYLFDPSKADTISHLLVNYLNNNEYFKRIQRNDIEHFKKLIKEYDEKESEMELIKKNFYDKKQNVTNFFGFDIYNDIVDIQKKKYEMETTLKSFNSWEFISHPLIPKTPYNDNIRYYLIFLISGFLFGSVIILIINKPSS